MLTDHDHLIWSTESKGKWIIIKFMKKITYQRMDKLLSLFSKYYWKRFAKIRIKPLPIQ